MPALAPNAVVAGFALGGSLIVAIGAQNAFVLRQGLRRQRVLAVAAICTGCDWLLIAIGAGGLGRLVGSTPLLVTAVAWLGAAFLFVYGARSFWSALRPGALDADASATITVSLATTVAAAFAVSLLNPHALLDTVVLTGGIAAQYPLAERASFAGGAMLASTAWFFSLAYGARLLAPVFARPQAWRVLDALVGAVMWWIALSLVLGWLAPR